MHPGPKISQAVITIAFTRGLHRQGKITILCRGNPLGFYMLARAFQDKMTSLQVQQKCSRITRGMIVTKGKTVELGYMQNCAQAYNKRGENASNLEKGICNKHVMKFLL